MLTASVSAQSSSRVAPKPPVSPSPQPTVSPSAEPSSSALGSSSGSGAGLTGLRPTPGGPAAPAGPLPTLKELEARVAFRGGFHEVRSRHFLVKTDIDARFAAELAAFMDRMREGFDALLPGTDRVAAEGVVPLVVVYGDREDYRALSRDNSRGLFRWEYETRGGRRTMTEFAVYSYAAGPAERAFAGFPRTVLLHEGCHLLLQSRAGFETIPPWFQEGLAGVLEQWDLAEGIEANLARITARRRSADAVAEALRRGRLPPLREMAGQERMDVDGFGRRTTLNYRRAEALIVFLLSDPPGGPRRKLLRGAYERFLDGKPDDAHAHLFSGDAGGRLEADWVNWVRGR
jgi:hypothetical protein